MLDSKPEKLTVLFLLLVGVAAVIMVVDFQTKAAILDQINRYERLRADEVRGQGPPTLRNDYDGRSNGAMPRDMVPSRDGTVEKTRNPAKSNTRKRPASRSDSGGTTEVQESGKPLGT